MLERLWWSLILILMLTSALYGTLPTAGTLTTQSPDTAALVLKQLPRGLQRAVLLHLAGLANQSQQYGEAVTLLTAALELDPHSPALFLQRGQMYLALYEWDRALADYNAALDIDPHRADAYYHRGILLYSILQTGVDLRDDALADFRRSLALAPDGNYAADAARYVTMIEAELNALNSP